MLRNKAKTNLMAGEALAALGFADPAASRYYYAMYQAAVHALTQQGWTPGRLQSGALEWGHVVVMNNASLIRGSRADRALFDSMRRMRTVADHEVDSVDPSLLAVRSVSVREFVEGVVR